jgi:hypothetical protein
MRTWPDPVAQATARPLTCVAMREGTAVIRLEERLARRSPVEAEKTSHVRSIPPQRMASAPVQSSSHRRGKPSQGPSRIAGAINKDCHGLAGEVLHGHRWFQEAS